MLRKTITVLSAVSAAAALTAATVTPAGPTAGGARIADDVTVVGRAILAPSAFELAAAPRPAAAATVNAACQDTTYALSGWQLPRRFSWYYNPRGAPASVASTAVTAIRNGSWTLFHAGYRCGSISDLSTTERYVGSSGRSAQVSSSGTCTGNDNVSVVSWGSLPPNTLAYTCVYYRTSTRTVLASDTLIDNKIHAWFTALPPGCSGQWDLQSVMVHERGHTAGLSHVDEAVHSSQTMSPKTPPCSTAQRVLGAGDVEGLKSMYGL